MSLTAGRTSREGFWVWGPFFSGFDRTATVDSIQKGNIRKEKQGGFRSENIFSVLLGSPISRNDSVGEKKGKKGMMYPFIMLNRGSKC